MHAGTMSGTLCFLARRHLTATTSRWRIAINTPSTTTGSSTVGNSSRSAAQHSKLPAGQCSCVCGFAGGQALGGLSLNALDFIARFLVVHLHLLKTGVRRL